MFNNNNNRTIIDASQGGNGAAATKSAAAAALPSSSSPSRTKSSSFLFCWGIVVGIVFGQVFVTTVDLISFASPSRHMPVSSFSPLGSYSSSNNNNNNNQHHHLGLGQETISTDRQPPEKRFADGCLHVFLDVGANRGVHGRFLLEPHLYPLATKARGFYQQVFGTQYDNRDVCVFAFEPNPRHHARLQHIREAYATRGWRYTVIPYGVSNQDDVLNFYRRSNNTITNNNNDTTTSTITTAGGDNHNNNNNNNEEWGFTALPPSNFPKEQPVRVPVIRLASWIQEHVQHRRLPEQFHGNYTNANEPKVIMKMDIEGMEYRVFPDLIYSGVFCQVLDLVFGEVHRARRRFPLPLAHDRSLATKQEAESYWQILLRSLQISTGSATCTGRFVEEDDETYLHDGIPLPYEMLLQSGQ